MRGTHTAEGEITVYFDFCAHRSRNEGNASRSPSIVELSSVNNTADGKATSHHSFTFLHYNISKIFVSFLTIRPITMVFFSLSVYPSLCTKDLFVYCHYKMTKLKVTEREKSWAVIGCGPMLGSGAAAIGWGFPWRILGNLNA